MDFLNQIMGADLSNVDIELPDELGTSVLEVFGNAYQVIAEVAVYLYGDNPTNEQFQEAATIMILWLRKRVFPDGIGG